VSTVAVGFLPTRAQAADPPPPTKGFQLALRAGIAAPFGYLSATTLMSDALSVQGPLLVDVGGKPIRQLFIGAYLGVAVGGAAGQIAKNCNDLGVSCIGVGGRGGLLVEANLRPGEAVNPWVGAGFGYELGYSSGSAPGTTISNFVRGFEYTHLLGGIDFRLQEWFGIGPFLDFSIGKYDFAQSRSNAGGLGETRGGDITEKAFHYWLIVGPRAVLLP
jgi:hypothetical protein